MNLLHIFVVINMNDTNIYKLNNIKNNKFRSFLKFNSMANEFSFKKGWAQVQQGDIRTVRDKLMIALKIKTRMAFLNRMKGKVEPRASEARAIEQIFAEHHITDIWGEA